ncbi:MAG: MGMT family protein [Desulfonatronovibrio sp. MSAO_Bac4]|nr:MAG: MGMT family protein [Desulfonatronovibrio sp. MSAO_Bac4]
MKQYQKNQPIKKHKYCSQSLAQEYFSNTFFSLTLYWKNDLIFYIDLETSGKASYPAVTFSTYSSVVQEALNQYQRKQAPHWPDPPLNWSEVSSFQQRVYTTLLKNVPWGQTISYGQLAKLCNIPGGARAVGRSMAANPWPVIVPCHRVLSTDGRLGGFSSGLKLKQTLLKLEGLNQKQP